MADGDSGFTRFLNSIGDSPFSFPIVSSNPLGAVDWWGLLKAMMATMMVSATLAFQGVLQGILSLPLVILDGVEYVVTAFIAGLFDGPTQSIRVAFDEAQTFVEGSGFVSFVAATVIVLATLYVAGMAARRIL